MILQCGTVQDPSYRVFVVVMLQYIVPTPTPVQYRQGDQHRIQAAEKMTESEQSFTVIRQEIFAWAAVFVFCRGLSLMS